MRHNLKVVRLVGLVAIIAGALLVVAGGATWITVRSQLVAENITIPDDAMAFQGNLVDGPLDAYVQADIINHHALEGSGGLETFRQPGATTTADTRPAPVPAASRTRAWVRHAPGDPHPASIAGPEDVGRVGIGDGVRLDMVE